MQREIKFRAWDKDRKQMYSHGIIEVPIRSINNVNDYGWELMQYTGLKDKNGKEIYEGDILKAYPNNSEYIGKVYYEDAQWFGACDYLNYAVAYSGAEVIGNVYESPELLEVSE